jgi:NhaP-type Na+/H+ or K+/H+ antiporter
MYLTLALISGFILLYAGFAGRVEGSKVSGAMVFTAYGLLVGPAALGILELHVDGEIVRTLAELALAVILFVDAAHADKSVVRASYGILIRLLAVALPLTILAGFGVGTLLFPGLTVVAVALIATMLAPTDAALGKPVVTNQKLPAHIREGLNVESGLNDGICVPILLLFLAMATREAGEALTLSHMWDLFLEEVGIGAVVGISVTLAAAVILRWTAKRGWITELWSRLVVASLAVTCFAAAQWVGGSGLIAAFLGGLTFGSLAKKHKHELLHSGEVMGEVFTLLTWVVFGAVVVGQVLSKLSWQTAVYAALSLTVVRMVPVFLSLTGSGVSTRGKLFMGWFGPRGLASIVFAIIVAQADLQGGDVISLAVAVTVIMSVVAHGISATPLSERFARQVDSEG